MKRVLWVLAAITIAICGVVRIQPFATSARASSATLRSEAITLTGIIRGCMQAIQKGDNVRPSDAAALEVVVRGEQRACAWQLHVFYPRHGNTQLEPARVAGRVALNHAIDLTIDQSATINYDQYPAHDTTGDLALQAVVQGVNDERAFFATIPRFIREVARALHMPIPAP